MQHYLDAGKICCCILKMADGTRATIKRIKQHIQVTPPLTLMDTLDNNDVSKKLFSYLDNDDVIRLSMVNRALRGYGDPGQLTHRQRAQKQKVRHSFQQDRLWQQDVEGIPAPTPRQMHDRVYMARALGGEQVVFPEGFHNFMFHNPALPAIDAVPANP